MARGNWDAKDAQMWLARNGRDFRLAGTVVDCEEPLVMAHTLAKVRVDVLNSGIFERVLGLAASEDNFNLQAAFGATDILHQCLLQCRVDPEMRHHLGHEQRNRILTTLTAVLYGSDYGLAVLASKGLIAGLDADAPRTSRMSWRTAVVVVIMRRIFTRRKKVKKRLKGSEATSLKLDRTLRVI